MSVVRPEFDHCRFDVCDLKGVDFNGASFVDTVFAGELRDVWFRGGFAYPDDDRRFGVPRKNLMARVSFAAADLRWNTFSNHCDLSTVTIPSDGKHRLYNHWKSRLETARNAAQLWEEDERIAAQFYLDLFRTHAATQDWYILSEQEVIEELGEAVGVKLLSALGAPHRPEA